MMSSNARLVALGLTLASVLAASTAAYAQPPALRVVVRVTSDTDRRLLDRVRGQLSDVPVSLHPTSQTPLEPGFASQLEHASELSTDDRTVVVWFRFRRIDAQRQQVLVHIATPHLERVFTRRVDATTGSGELDSGLMESTALVVRGAIKALSEGGSIGVTPKQAVEQAADLGTTLTTPQPTTTGVGTAASEAASEPAKQEPAAAEEAPADTEPAAADEDEDEDEPASVPAEPESAAEEVDEVEPHEAPVREATASSGGAPVSFRSYLGWQSVMDGESRIGSHGAHLELGVTWHQLVLAATATASLASTIDDRWARLHLARHGAGGLIGWQPRQTGVLRWQLAVRAGLALFHRRTEAKVDALEAASPAVTTSFVFGPEARLMWLPSAVGIGIVVGLDVLLRPPRFEVNTESGGSMQNVRLWKLQPRIGLGLEVQLS